MVLIWHRNWGDLIIILLRQVRRSGVQFVGGSLLTGGPLLRVGAEPGLGPAVSCKRGAGWMIL